MNKHTGQNVSAAKKSYVTENSFDALSCMLADEPKYFKKINIEEKWIKILWKVKKIQV
jgi:hypothetical protein